MNAADFRVRVARRLGLVSVGENLAPEDGELIHEAYGSLWALLDAHSLVSWDIADDIPESYEQVIIGMTAAALVDEFRIAEPRRSMLKAEGAFGFRQATPLEAQLRALSAATYISETVQTEYF